MLLEGDVGVVNRNNLEMVNYWSERKNANSTRYFTNVWYDRVYLIRDSINWVYRSFLSKFVDIPLCCYLPMVCWVLCLLFSVKFYCFRHSKPEMRLGRAKRKRAFEDDTPKVSIHSNRWIGLPTTIPTSQWNC